jgi:putative Mn2+ efflux pump MntP
MTTRIDIGKVVVGAFLIPWWNRGAFCRALAVPFALVLGLTVVWQYSAESVSEWAIWLLYIPIDLAFTLFAVTCHRLVLLEPSVAATTPIPVWTRRETRFFIFFVLGWLIPAAVALGWSAANRLQPAAGANALAWVLLNWLGFVVVVVAFYLVARCSLVFPATAIDQETSLKWAWHTTRHNGWRLTIVLWLVPAVTSSLTNLLDRLAAGVVAGFVLTAVACATITFEVAALSLCYRDLTKDPTAPAA